MTVRRAWFVVVLLIYVGLAYYQLGLPGLHYDEAKEAGLNAMEILTGAPVTAFRGAGVTLGGRMFPLMVQDYIGALNVYLALPILALSGIGVPNLRLLPIATGLLALVLLERAISEWVAFGASNRTEQAATDRRRTPISWSGLITITLLAVSPSYVFWARQGIFVTNLMLPFVFLCMWQGLVWLRAGTLAGKGACAPTGSGLRSNLPLYLAALAGGLALYAKLLAVWVVAPFILLAGGWWLIQTIRHTGRAPRITWAGAIGAGVLFLLPLLPLIAFNLQTGGTFASIGGNLGTSYYGVNNANVLGNLPIRGQQLIQVLRGEQFWYLGGSYANVLAPWLAVLALVAGLWRDWRRTLPPLLLVSGAFLFSLFTLSDLFITHYVLLQPLLIGAVGVALGTWLEPGAVRRISGVAVAVLVAVWLVFDFTNSFRYHSALAASGGLADHSDASYHLAYHLRYHGMGAPIALDWGMDAPVRYLTEGAVTPIEIFGYASPAEPDADFRARLAPFLANPDNRYLLHAKDAEVFRGRREAFLAAVADVGGRAVVEQQFAQSNGTPLYEIWRVEY